MQIRNTKIRSRKFFDLSAGKVGAMLGINSNNINFRAHHNKFSDAKSQFGETLLKGGVEEGDEHNTMNSSNSRKSMTSISPQKKKHGSVGAVAKHAVARKTVVSGSGDKPKTPNSPTTHRRHQSMHGSSSAAPQSQSTIERDVLNSPMPTNRSIRLISPFNALGNSLDNEPPNDLRMESWGAHNEKHGNNFSPLSVGNNMNTSPFNENAHVEQKQAAIAAISTFKGLGFYSGGERATPPPFETKNLGAVEVGGGGEGVGGSIGGGCDAKDRKFH